MSEKQNIYQRILAVASDVGYVKKDVKVQAGSAGNYAGVSHDAVVAKLRGAMIKHGVAMSVTQTAEHITEGQTKSGAPKIRYAAWYTMRLINADAPEQIVEQSIHVHAEDGGDKAPGKSISYAVKMLLLKTFLLETGENDESRHLPDEVAVCTDEQVAEIIEMMLHSGVDREKFLAWIGVANPAEIPAARYDAAVKTLQARIDKNEAAAHAGDQRHD